MKILPIIAFSAVALGAHAGAQQAPAPQEAPPAEAPSATDTVSTLSDAECLAIVNYMRRAEKLTREIWAGTWKGEGSMAEQAIQAVTALPMEGMPDDFRRFMEEYGALVSASLAKGNELSRKISDSNVDDAGDYLREFNKNTQKLREDKLALAARYARASVLGTDWEQKVYDSAKTDLRTMNESATAYFKTSPLEEKEKPDNRVAEYLLYLTQQPQPELTATEARHLLERRETMKRLAPRWDLEDGRTLYGVHEGTSYAIRLPQDAATGCMWKLADNQVEGKNITVEWQTVPTESLKKEKPHGEARTLTPLPSTPETTVALVNLKKAGTAILRFQCLKEGEATPLATKVITFYIRRVDDYRPLMETDPLPEPEPLPHFEPGVDSLTDEECLRLYRFLRDAYCDAMEESATAVSRRERVQLNVVAAGGLAYESDKLPRDFHDYLTEYHNLIIRHAAKERAIDRKLYDLRYSKEDTREERKALRKQRKELNKEKEDIEKMLKEKYPRAIILRNATLQEAIRSVFNSYNNMDDEAKRFHAENPDMKEASHRIALPAYFRSLAAKRRQQEDSVPAARRFLKRLDALRVMKVIVGSEPYECIYGEEDEVGGALILPLAPVTGYDWKLATPLAEDAPVKVDWHRMPTARLEKLREAGVISSELPKSEQVAIATVTLKKKGETTLRFVCTSVDDNEPLLTERAEVEIRAKDEDEDELNLPELPPVPEGEGVAALTDAECIAIASYLHRSRNVTLHIAADSIEQEKHIGETDFARIVAAELTDDVPADMRDFVHASSALICSTEEKLAPLNSQLREIQRAEADDAEEQARPLMRQCQNIWAQHRYDARALELKHPRAAFLSEHMGSCAVQEVLADLNLERSKARAFLKAHPELQKGKRATVIAYLRHVAGEKRPELTAEAARESVTKLDLISRLGYSENGAYSSWRSPEEETWTRIFPDDRKSGYSWQLATPLPEDSPVQLEWLTVPSAELRELRNYGVLNLMSDISDAPETTIATIRAVKEGKITLHFVFTKPGEEDPLLSRKIEFDVRAKEED